MAFARASERPSETAPLHSGNWLERFLERREERRERREWQKPVKEPKSHRGEARKRAKEEKASENVLDGKRDGRGWKLAGGGRTQRILPTPEFRSTTLQVAGFFPFVVGGSLPLIGTPLGEHTEGRGWVCGDPISWFLHDLINNPSGFVMARRGVGKSTLIRRICGFLPYKGILPMVLSDWKPDYVGLMNEIDGKVISLDRSSRFVNPLDPGPVARVLDRLPEELRAKVWDNIRSRRFNVANGLCALALHRRLETHEENMLSAALLAWDAENPGVIPVFSDIQALIKARHPRVRAQAQDRSSDERYDDRVEGLMDALNSLTGGNDIFGQVFANHTTTELDLDKPMVFDLSAFEDMDPALQAGVQLVCWTYGSTALAGAKLLADAGLAKRRIYMLVMDELWRALRAAEFMVDRVDEITRLNRTIGLGQLLCTHGMDDLKLHNAEATAKAWNFVGASEMVFLGGLNPSEFGNLEEAFAISESEKELLTMWAQIGEPDPETGEGGTPLGRGKFMIKGGKKPGIPFAVNLTQVERERKVHDTSSTFNDAIEAARRSAAPVLDEYLI